MSLTPSTAFWNKDYQTNIGKILKKHLVSLHSSLSSKLDITDNNPYSENGIYFADDCFITLRNLGFLKDPLFVKAVGPRSSDRVLMGRIWRLWFISWSLSVKWASSGMILDFGTYNGKAMFTACKYAHLKNKNVPLNQQNIVLADIFENPPKEAKKADHCSTLHLDVESLFSSFKNKIIAKGFIPESIKDIDFSKGIKWCQIDLNSAAADLDAFSLIYDYLLPGAHVIFDDYGFSRYHSTQKLLNSFLEDKPEVIFELPTGQGLLIKSN